MPQRDSPLEHEVTEEAEEEAPEDVADDAPVDVPEADVLVAGAGDPVAPDEIEAAVVAD